MGLTVVEQVFGKKLKDLTAEECRVYRCATRAASYYRRYEQNKKYQREVIQRKKLEVIAALGWVARCVECDYDRYIGALHFHHSDPTQKESDVLKLPLAQAIEEAKKCELLCANCHAEAHEHLNAAGRPAQALHPKVAKYLEILGISRPPWIAQAVPLGT